MPASVLLTLHHPPVVETIGVGVHGITGLHDSFLLPDHWQFHLYAYSATLTLGSGPGFTGAGKFAIRPGHVSFVPPGVPVSFHYRGRSEHIYVHLRLPGGGPAELVPVMQDAGDRAPALSAMLHQALAAAPHRPEQAIAEVWAVLWRVAGLPNAGAGRRNADVARHPAVAAAMDHIEARLAEPLSVPEIARRAGLSHNHLTRLFRMDTGDTVVAYIRRRRMARAEHLLRRSTMPIPAVAASVGIGDLQAFNKACRRVLGASPRSLRFPRPDR